MISCSSLVVLAALLPPQGQTPAPAAPPSLASIPQVDVMRAVIGVKGADPATIDVTLRGMRGGQAYVLGNEGRPGVTAVIGGFARTPGVGGKAGVSFLFFLHRYEGGLFFLEAQILNDAMRDAPGKVEVNWKIELASAVVAEGSKELPDQTGVMIVAGKPRFAPRSDLLAQYVRGLPSPASMGGVPRDDADPKPDADPNPNTHAPGSPRNRYVAHDAAKFLFTQDPRYLERLMDFVAAQARRPYHLSEATGEPFYQSRYPEAYFVEGHPELKTYRETFGRILMTDADRDTGNMNGWDHEHMDVEELYAAYMLIGSRVARREIVLIAEELMSTRYVREERKFQHSARAFGWCARALVRAYQVTGARRYLDGVKRMMASVEAHCIKDGPYPGLVPQDPKDDHLKNERWESPFMVAVAASALALYHDVEPNDPQALEMLEFCGDLLVNRGWSDSANGFFYNYSLDSSGHGENAYAQTNGVATWICSPLVEIAAALPPEKAEKKERYLSVAKRLFDKNREDQIAVPTHDYFYRWFLRAQKEFVGN